MGLAEKVDTFQKQIRSEKQVVSASLWAINRAIVSDACYQSGRRGNPYKRAQPLSNGSFVLQAAV
jgi:hypothetical protein